MYKEENKLKEYHYGLVYLISNCGGDGCNGKSYSCLTKEAGESERYTYVKRNIIIRNGDNKSLPKIYLGPGCTKPGLQAEKKNRAQHKYKQNIAMTDCLQAGCRITRHSVIAIFFFVFMVCSIFFACNLGLIYLRP